MDLSYLITPFWAWLLAGCTKFAINTIKERRLAFDLIGYGGLPSNHSSIVSSAAAIIAFKSGIEEPAFAVAVTLAFIVMLDANSLRQKVGLQAKAINQLNKNTHSYKPLRERMGHTRVEIISGCIVGIVAAWTVTLVW
ncbi:divergent PAP2 family protein [Vibrio parahaemolyticus]|uniref:divergent PAP2 family protein n=1 Tax=Vibrio parahaemolyticus TaxID=670 RepID=UPI0013761E1E|nr:divergent PAP2 family protein [Vibrio parahaemolyticus]MBM5286045.1 divergent PAP2 family protein [Vibrio parahaemolyticus]MCF9091764.1 divergent PAP2 family protein [Vibrio parahaemolyticus]MCF9102700.1 divergent PAP2 family protein [Vibrio parahaemolyticus]NCN14242.1 divergent PAP2 family protein [Vibrio parahaemolyticus]